MTATEEGAIRAEIMALVRGLGDAFAEQSRARTRPEWASWESTVQQEWQTLKARAIATADGRPIDHRRLDQLVGDYRLLRLGARGGQTELNRERLSKAENALIDWVLDPVPGIHSSTEERS